MVARFGVNRVTQTVISPVQYYTDSRLKVVKLGVTQTLSSLV